MRITWLNIFLTERCGFHFHTRITKAKTAPAESANKAHGKQSQKNFPHTKLMHVQPSRLLNLILKNKKIIFTCLIMCSAVVGQFTWEYKLLYEAYGPALTGSRWFDGNVQQNLLTRLWCRTSNGHSLSCSARLAVLCCAPRKYLFRLFHEQRIGDFFQLAV